MRRRPNPEISDRAQTIERILATVCARGERDKAQGLALILLGIELLEELDVDKDAIRAAFDKALDAPVSRDPRFDTSGT